MKVWLHWAERDKFFLLSENMSVYQIDEFCSRFSFSNVQERSYDRQSRSPTLNSPVLRDEDGYAPPEGMRWGVLSWDIVLSDMTNTATAHIEIMHLEDGQ